MFGRYDQEFTGRSVTHTEQGASYGQSRSVQQRDRLDAAAVMRFAPGEFAGVLAEGEPAEFHRQLVAPRSQVQPLDAFAATSEAERQACFAQIGADVRAMLSSAPPAAPVETPSPDSSPTPATPDAASWEEFV